MNEALTVVWGQPLTPALLVGLAAALILGILIGVIFSRSGSKPAAAAALKGEKRSPSDAAFMKGLTHLMADHTDQAIEEFTKAVTLNSETVETYVVLGNLFRQKGEIERAVRIRQSIIARQNLTPAVKLQAMYDLGLDYKKGGLFNRAAEAFHEVLNMDPRHQESGRQLVTLYEEIRDWDNAFASLKKLDKLTGSDSRNILAHYKTEQGKELVEANKLDRAEESFSQAIGVDKRCLDAYLHYGDLELSRGRSRKAVSLWRKAVKLEPKNAHLVVNRVAHAEQALGKKAVSNFLGEMDTEAAEATTLLAMAQYHHRKENDEEALALLAKAVGKDPAQLSLHHLRGRMALESGDMSLIEGAYAELLDQITSEWDSYQCGECGFVSHHLTWKCPRCHRWDTMTPSERPA